MYRGSFHSALQSLSLGFLLSCEFLIGAPRIVAQAATDKPPVASTDDQTSYKIKASSNLVVVRVVVRNGQGKPILGLKREDFKLFDRGKEQPITQFEEETAIPPSAPPTLDRRPATAGAPTAPPQRFLALYFDDLNTSETDMMQARDAADKFLASGLRPNERVAIFTSGKMLSAFTSDPKQIHDALAKLHPNARALTRIHECPDLSDYQAFEIMQFEDDPNSNAWLLALDEGRSCIPPVGGSLIKLMARNIVDQAQIQARSSLQGLDQVVKYISQMRGQRTIILASPGFMSQSEQYQVDRIIDHALHAQVVISSLDPKGLALLMRESDVTRHYIPTANSGAISAMHSLDSGQEFVTTDVLVEVAQGTGGEFFHNSNDLKAGFGALAGSPVYYILAFTPNDLKPDGKFHSLKVALTQKQKGVHIQARRGYFAPKNGSDAEADAKQREADEAKTRAEEQIREAILSQNDSQQLPVELGAKLTEVKGETRELSLFAHLDTKSLHFQKEAGQNLNTLIFSFAIFDQKQNLIEAKQRQAHISITDAQLPGLLKSGVDIGVVFQLKPGVYRVRTVALDSAEHNLTAFSRNVKIP